MAALPLDDHNGEQRETFAVIFFGLLPSLFFAFDDDVPKGEKGGKRKNSQSDEVKL